MYIALSVLMAIIASNGRIELLFMYIPFYLWLILRKTSYFTMLCAVLFSVFFFIMTTERNQLLTELPEQQLLQWTTTVQIQGGNIRGFMKTTTGQKVYVVYSFQHEGEKQHFSSQVLAGQRYNVTGKLVKPPEAHHEFAFQMKDYLKSHRAIGVVEIKSLVYVDTKRSFTTLLSKQRQQMTQRIEMYFPKSLVAEAKALLVGDQQDVEQEQQRAYQKLGITHLFAISGLHVALISLVFQQLLLRLHIRTEIVLLILVIALPSYAVLAGGAPSVWRAVVTVLILILTKSLHQSIPMESALACCFLLFVLYEPNMIYQVGFQLSFLATVAIILSTKLLANYKTWYSKSLWITFSCQLLVMPLLLYHFYEMSLSSFFMNLLFVPLFSYIILPINIILLLLTYIAPTLFKLLALLYEPCRSLLTACIEHLQAYPYQMWNPGRPSTFELFVLLITVLLVFSLFEAKKHRMKALLFLISVALLLSFNKTRHADLRITFLSVGQGDSTLIELPNRREVYLVDSGGVLRFAGDKWRQSPNEYEVGRQIIVPYLKGRGITTVNRLILTHADADHVEGAEEVMQEVKIKEIQITPNSFQERAMDDLEAEAIKQQIHVKEKFAGEKWRVANVEFEYVMPRDVHYEGNNDSLVLVINYKGYRIVLPGDLEKEGEAELVKYNAAAIENTTVLRSGHHGSKTSTTEKFLQVVNPKLIVHSNGLNNRYHHPAKEVVDRIAEAGIPSFNTSTDGTIQLRITHKLFVLQRQKKYELSK